ncbi:MAG TPA: hypothetical protein PLO82_10405 [Bacteroidia bacterium]|nr:hypothetical protein [Bacteroidia bacterium]
MNLSDVINTVKAIDPENFDKYRLSSFEFEEECGGIITDNEDDDIDEETARNILMKLNEWKNIDHT